ncbi:hypothetical protein HRI_001513800 [Hibiscus trionum]|uniref:Reverse transcriptase Ty1/copia-type domain-containing protein n=1 Tax=Hibiscus trionum TaxID=183268 RepID=A0A9W7HM88_HIBTR|nr:hypothetical protein HRI_001513800 [Hibiscus trionum]
MEESEDEEFQTQEPLETLERLVVREIHRTARFTDIVAYALPVVDDSILVTYQEAMQSLESDKWKSTIDEEMQYNQKNNTCDLVHLPKAQLNLRLAQLNVMMTFLHGDLKEEIYMTQLEGYKNAGGEKYVFKLNKSLYVLK